MIKWLKSKIPRRSNPVQPLKQDPPSPSTAVISNRFRSIYQIGSGATGPVYSAYDRNTKEYVALKSYRGLSDDSGLSLQCLREITVMRHARHPNVLPLLDIIHLEDYLLLIMPLKASDLHSLIASAKPLRMAHIQHLMFQLFSGLAHLHACGIVHRDIKPGNILVDKQWNLTICDFGLSRGIPTTSRQECRPEEEEDEEGRRHFHTQQVVTQYYRAPEILLGQAHHSAALDLWAAGCVLGEMFTGHILFFDGGGGADFRKQLHLIFRALPKPSAAYLRQHIHNPAAHAFLQPLPEQPPQPLAAHVAACLERRASSTGGGDGSGGGNSSDSSTDDAAAAIDLLLKLLHAEPGQRISAADALRHPFFAGCGNGAVPPPMPAAAASATATATTAAPVMTAAPTANVAAAAIAAVAPGAAALAPSDAAPAPSPLRCSLSTAWAFPAHDSSGQAMRQRLLREAPLHPLAAAAVAARRATEKKRQLRHQSSSIQVVSCWEEDPEGSSMQEEEEGEGSRKWGTSKGKTIAIAASSTSTTTAARVGSCTPVSELGPATASTTSYHQATPTTG